MKAMHFRGFMTALLGFALLTITCSSTSLEITKPQQFSPERRQLKSKGSTKRYHYSSKGGSSSKSGKGAKSSNDSSHSDSGSSSDSASGSGSSKSSDSDSDSSSSKSAKSSKGGSGTSNLDSGSVSSKSSDSDSDASKSGKSSKGSSHPSDSDSGSSSSRKHSRYSYGDSSKSSKSGKGSKGGKSSKDSKISKSGKNSKGSNSSDSEDSHWDDYHRYWYKYWKENIWKPETNSPTASPISHPTSADTQHPAHAPTVDQDGIYHHDNGSVGCYPFSSSGDMEYDGQIKEEVINFSYTMTVDPDDGGDIEKKIKAVEAAFIAFLVGELDCETPSSSKDPKSRRRHLGRRRKLKIIGLNPSPADNVVGKCFY